MNQGTGDCFGLQRVVIHWFRFSGFLLCNPPSFSVFLWFFFFFNFCLWLSLFKGFSNPFTFSGGSAQGMPLIQSWVKLFKSFMWRPLLVIDIHMLFFHLCCYMVLQCREKSASWCLNVIMHYRRVISGLLADSLGLKFCTQSVRMNCFCQWWKLIFF